MHNKGIHYNAQKKELNLVLNDYEFIFSYDKIIQISWGHYRELLIAASNLLIKIVQNQKVLALPEFSDRNIIIINRDESKNDID